MEEEKLIQINLSPQWTDLILESLDSEIDLMQRLLEKYEDAQEFTEFVSNRISNLFDIVSEITMIREFSKGFHAKV